MVAKTVFINGFGYCEIEIDTQNLEMISEAENVENLEQYNSYQKKWFNRSPLEKKSICDYKIFNYDKIRTAYKTVSNILKNF